MFRKKAIDALYSLFVQKEHRPTKKPILELPASDRGTTFYTYLWSHERLSAGEWVQLTYRPGKRDLISEFTGGCETADGVFSYDGAIVGCTFNDYFLDRLKPLAKTWTVRVFAYCKAWNRAGYPELELRADFRAINKG